MRTILRYCHVSTCDRWAEKGGYCTAHSGKVCQFEGCDNTRVAKGWCQKHYIALRNQGQQCRVVGCDKIPTRRGLCNKHYIAWTRGASGIEPAPRDNRD